MALKDSDKADFGFSKTDKFEAVCLTPTTPMSGIEVNLLMSSVFKIEFSKKKITNIINNGIINPKKTANI